MYACYSPEDEMLVLPILGRMYNEGFRLWSASLAEKASDFVSVRHVAASSCVVMFMSHNMLERINSGVPEVLAACRSSLLRAVILLDDAAPDNRMFALSAPERVEYNCTNDSAFWLFAYSADYMERCRGPWPEKKLELREPTYDDVHQEAIAAEYISLEKIITRGGTSPDQVTVHTYPNNRGYIQPQPDELSYEPLKKVEAAKTSHDRDYDAAMALLDECADKQVDIIINHTRPGENTVPARPSLSPLKPMPDVREEMRTIRWELEQTQQPVERPERKIEPEVRTKADMIVQPEDKPEVRKETAAVMEELPTIVLPVEDLSPKAIAAGIEQIAAAAEAKETEQTVAQEIPTEEENAPEQPELHEAEEIRPEDWSDIVSRESADGKNMVQVVVRRQQPAVRVTPVKKRVITEPISAEESGRTTRLSRSSGVNRMRNAEFIESAAFEQYVRDIALAAMAAEETEEDAPVSHRRYGRSARTTASEAAVPTVTLEGVAVQKTETAEPTAQEDEIVTETQEKTTARKNRYPHNSGMLAGLLAALRSERMQAADSTLEEADDKSDDEAYAQAEQAAPVISETHNDVKIIRLSDAISERKVSDLQAAVNKFMRLDVPSEPASAPLTVRTYGIRR